MIKDMPMLIGEFEASNSPMSIGISFIIVGVAALSLVLDFDFLNLKI